MISMSYPAPEAISAIGSAIYCDRKGCSLGPDNRQRRGFCPSDTLIRLPVEDKFALPEVASLNLRQRIKASCGGFDTTLVFDRKMAATKCGSAVTVLVQDPDR